MSFVSRAVVWLLVLAIGGVAGYAAAKLLPGDDSATRISVFQDWRLVCPPLANQPCEASQDLVDVRTGTVLAHLAIVGSSGARSLTITVPHNLLLAPGIALSIGNGPTQPFPYDVCDRVGCIVPISMDAKGEANLRGAQGGKITVVNIENKPTTIPFSLRGFGSALDGLDRAEARRGAWWRKLLP